MYKVVITDNKGKYPIDEPDIILHKEFTKLDAAIVKYVDELMFYKGLEFTKRPFVDITSIDCILFDMDINYPLDHRAFYIAK